MVTVKMDELCLYTVGGRKGKRYRVKEYIVNKGDTVQVNIHKGCMLVTKRRAGGVMSSTKSGSSRQ